MMDRRYTKRMDRYWGKMKKYAVNSIANLDPSGWFDYWHCHIDWQGKGDKKPENREASIMLGYEILNMVEDFKLNVRGPIQSWWFIHDNSYEDAVYLHSPNENKSPFPYDFEGVDWGKTNNDFLIKLVDQNRFKIGTMINEYGTTYVVASNG